MMNNKKQSYNCHILSIVASTFLFVITANAHADENDYNYPYENQNPAVETEQVQNLLNPSPPLLISDTLGPSFTLTQGTASNRVIAKIDTVSPPGNKGYYSSTDCSGTAIASNVTAVSGTAFTFTDNKPIYFGQAALSALSAANTSTHCIKVVLNQLIPVGSGAFLALLIQNITCNGTTCTGGHVCYTTPNSGQWGTGTTPAC